MQSRIRRSAALPVWHHCVPQAILRLHHMHCAGGMILLAAGLKVEPDSGKRELSLAMLSMLYISFSGVINFDVRDFKPIHFTFLFGVLVFSTAFAWLQWTRDCAAAYTRVSAAFVGLILFNCTVTRWRWPWMNVQAIAEIAWVTCLLAGMMI